MNEHEGVARAGGWEKLPGMNPPLRVHRSIRNPNDGPAYLTADELLVLSVYTLRRYALLVNLLRTGELDANAERLTKLLNSVGAKAVAEGYPADAINALMTAKKEAIISYPHICVWADVTIDNIDINPTLYSNVPFQNALAVTKAKLEAARLIAAHAPANPPAPQSQPQPAASTPAGGENLDDWFGPRNTPAPAPQPQSPAGSYPTPQTPAPQAGPGQPPVKFDNRKAYADDAVVYEDATKISADFYNGSPRFQFHRRFGNKGELPMGKLDVYLLSGDGSENTYLDPNLKAWLRALNLQVGQSISGKWRVYATVYNHEGKVRLYTFKVEVLGG